MRASSVSSSARDLCRRALQLQSEFGLSLNPDQTGRLESYLDLLLKWKRRVNLISEPSPERLLRLHFLESFWLAEHFLGNRSVLTDLGSGAGFPGLAAKIYRPRLYVSLVEKNAKKGIFPGRSRPPPEIARRINSCSELATIRGLAARRNHFDSGAESLAQPL